MSGYHMPPRYDIRQNAEYGRWHVTIDGSDDGHYDIEYPTDGRQSWQYDTLDGYETEQAAVESAFPFYAYGGYPMVYVGDGYMLCAKCMRQAWLDPDDADYEHARNGEISGVVEHEVPSTGNTCDSCMEYIPGCEPHCAECATELDADSFRNPVWERTSGDEYLCNRCIAEYVRNGCKVPDEPCYTYGYTVAERIKPGIVRLFEYQPDYRQDDRPLVSTRKGEYYTHHAASKLTAEDFRNGPMNW